MWNKWETYQKQLEGFNSQVYDIGDVVDFPSLTGSRDLSMGCQRITRCLTQEWRRSDLGWQTVWLGEHYSLIRDKFEFTDPSHIAAWNKRYDDWKRLKPDLCILCEDLNIDLPVRTEYYLDKWLPESYRLSPMQKEEPALGRPRIPRAPNISAASTTSIQSPHPDTNHSLSLEPSQSSQDTVHTAYPNQDTLSTSHVGSPRSATGLELSYPVEDGPVPPDGPSFLPPQGYSRTKSLMHDYYKSHKWYTEKWLGLSECIDTATTIRSLWNIREELGSLNAELKTLVRHVETYWMDENCLETAEGVQRVMNYIDVTAQTYPDVIPSWRTQFAVLCQGTASGKLLRTKPRANRAYVSATAAILLVCDGLL
ncbi:hypothetical protein QFC20_007265 [Naganishia adeliensis]|uniref:Uncharacterized protein n=1 Tax=Naganishia adeliensis TaxID=92952 RepID=A0ACC2V2I3_9TREE|nr:hypothetical protein QFC20_007265 [Naganishia adeliensis]